MGLILVSSTVFKPDVDGLGYLCCIGENERLERRNIYTKPVCRRGGCRSHFAPDFFDSRNISGIRPVEGKEIIPGVADIGGCQIDRCRWRTFGVGLGGDGERYSIGSLAAVDDRDGPVRGIVAYNNVVADFIRLTVLTSMHISGDAILIGSGSVIELKQGILEEATAANYD